MTFHKLLCRTAVTAAVMLFFGISAAGAEETLPPEEQEARKQLVGCKKSPLTQHKFLDILDDIIRHADLTDVAYIEGKLQTKFVYVPPFGELRDPSPYARGYIANVLFKTWISAQLQVSLNSDEYAEGKEPIVKREGSITFQVLNKPAFNFRDCGYLTKEQINQQFGGGFTETTGAMTGGDACKQLSEYGKYEPLSIFYNFDDHGHVEQVMLEQYAPSANSPHCGRINQ